ncbi:MAG: hypothetical protein H0X67_07805 [Acidobacteria bacterium]|nr:hypothetical protein [Acidobacteriota bacterium]
MRRLVAGILDARAIPVPNEQAGADLEARDRMKRALYEGDAWKNELEEIAMPMLESYQVALTTIPAAFVNDLHGIGESAGLAGSPPNGHAATPPLPRT